MTTLVAASVAGRLWWKGSCDQVRVNSSLPEHFAHRYFPNSFNVAIFHPHHYSACVYLHSSFISAPTAAQVAIDGNALAYVMFVSCCQYIWVFSR